MLTLKNFSLVIVGTAVVALGTSGTAQAASFLSTSDGQVGTVNTSTGAFTPLINGGPVFSDIALTSNGNLFGTTLDFNSALYFINQNTGSTTLLGNLGVFVNALAFSPNNILFGAGDSNLYTINTATGTASLRDTIPGFNSSGDLIFDSANSRFLATSLGDSFDNLFSIALDGTANLIGSIGFSNVFGLSFEGGSLFGYTSDRKQIIIDPTTGAGTFNRNVTGAAGEIFGATESVPEPTESVPEPTSVLGLLALGAFGGGSLLKRKQK